MLAINFPIQVGREIFQCLGNKATIFLGFTDEGSSFVYGYLVSADINIFMFKTLSVIYFFSFVVSMLFYVGALQLIVMKMGIKYV